MSTRTDRIYGLTIFAHDHSVYLLTGEPFWQLGPDDARRLATALENRAAEAEAEAVLYKEAGSEAADHPDC